ncbi:MAG: LPS export ABC transporter permease LptG [Pseudomonadota bacterium]
MLTTLDRYITGHANRAIVVVLSILIGLISLFALFEELDESQATYTVADALQYVLYTMPRRLDEIIVYGLFLGYLIALGRLAEQNEIVVCRSAGMSPLRLCRALTPSLLLWFALGTVVAEFVAPSAERSAEVNKLAAQFGDAAGFRRSGLWLRHDFTYMQVQAIGTGNEIFGIKQYHLNASRQLEQIVHANKGTYIEDRWKFEDVIRMTIGPDRTSREQLTDWTWQVDISPELLSSQAYLEPNKMSLAALYRQIGFARSQDSGVSQYELAFWSRIFRPLTYIGLMLLALAVVLGPLREVGMGVRLTVGIFAGLGFKYLQDLFAPAAMVYDIPALIAIAIPIATYWTVAIVFIRRNA